MDSRLARSSSRNRTSPPPVALPGDLCLISLMAIAALSALRHARIIRAPRPAKSTAVSFPIPELLPIFVQIDIEREIQLLEINKYCVLYERKGVFIWIRADMKMLSFYRDYRNSLGPPLRTKVTKIGGV